MKEDDEDIAADIKKKVTSWKEWYIERGLTTPSDAQDLEEDVWELVYPFVRRLLSEGIIDTPQAEEILSHCHLELSEFRRITHEKREQ